MKSPQLSSQELLGLLPGGSSQVNGQCPVRKAAALRPTDDKSLVEEGKNKPAQWAAVHAVFQAVMEQLNYDKRLYGWILLTCGM